MPSPENVNVPNPDKSRVALGVPGVPVSLTPVATPSRMYTMLLVGKFKLSVPPGPVIVATNLSVEDTYVSVPTRKFEVQLRVRPLLIRVVWKLFVLP